MKNVLKYGVFYCFVKACIVEITGIDKSSLYKVYLNESIRKRGWVGK
jgi:hypothetical protein